MSSIYSEYTIYKTNDLVRIVPTEAKKPATGTSPEQSEEASRMYLDIDRASPLTVRYVQSNGMIPVPSSGNLVTKPQKIYGILGFLPFTSRDVRMIVVTERKYVGDLPYPLFRVVKTDVVVLGTDAASAVSAENPDSSEYRRLLGRILKVKSLYFATSWDATLNAQKRSDVYDSDTLRGVPLWQRADKRLFWNFSLVQPLIDINANEWILPVFMGHAELKHTSINGTEFDFGIVSRRYRTRAGMRLFMRGIDSSNNTANTVETEQMLIIPDNSAAPAEKKLLASYVLMRGSIPVYWSQFPDVRYKPPMTLTEPHQVNTAAATEHFRALVRNYGAPVYCVNLIDLKGKELVLAEEFGKCAQEAKDAGVNIEYTHFDFHKECKGGKTERLSILLDRIKDSIDSIGFFAQSLPANVEALQAGMDSLATPFAKQSGCFRVNCIDSLDRTNVVQSLIARKVLEEQFIKFGVFKAPSETLDTYPDFLYIYKNWWADHADTISNQYTGTGAQKTDITRVGKRTFKGMIDDGINAITRYYKNNFTDGDMQDAYNLFLGVFVPPLEPKGSSFKPVPSKLPLLTIFGLALLMIVSALSARTNIGNKEWGKCFGFIVVIALAYYGIKFVIRHYGRAIVNNPRLIQVSEKTPVVEETPVEKEKEKEAVASKEDDEIPIEPSN